MSYTLITLDLDESIRIGDEVRLAVLEVRDDKVRLGIAAPVEVPVHRLEIHERIQRDGSRRKAK